MSHSHSETTNDDGHAGVSQVEPDDIGAAMLAVIGTMVAVIILLIGILLQAWFYSWRNDALAEYAVAAESIETPKSMALAEQQGQIGGYHWVKRETQTRAIPVTAAMKLVTDELAAESKEKSDK